jgi:hypothetical protein
MANEILMTPRDPTPQEIAAECARIRESWSLAEHYRRAGLQPSLPYRRHEKGATNYWRPPVVRCDAPG